MATDNLEKVIVGGYCIGCGACTLGLDTSDVHVKLNDLGRFQANLMAGRRANSAQAAAVCPFSDSSANEDRLAEEFLELPDMAEDPRLGRWLDAHAGHAAQGSFRTLGSSGGFTSWLLAELLVRKRVDAVIHVKPSVPDVTDPTLFRYSISETVDEIQRGAKSHYYPVELSGMLKHIRNVPGRYAVVGVPCFIKAIRLLCRQEAVFRDRIAFCIGLFCGHLKSTGFAEFLAWQCGVAPAHLRAIDFRTKLPGRRSSNYGVTVQGEVDGEFVTRTAVASELQGTDWGMGLFKYEACDYCDDITAETADVSVGDAWLPQFVNDSRGTNIVVVRNKELHALVKDAVAKRILVFSPLDSDSTAASQSANFRHRRQDLPYRLYLKDRSNLWRPKKRVGASPLHDAKRRRSIQDQRIKFRDSVPLLWRRAVDKGRLDDFLLQVEPLVRTYSSLYATETSRFHILRKWCKPLQRVLKKLTHRAASVFLT